MDKQLTALVILDGYGLSDVQKGNAVLKNSPYVDSLLLKYPHSRLSASGLDVGLPEGQMGNSEVGHLNIGAGRIVYQELTRITKSISDGDFFDNKELISAINNAKANKSKLHLMGLVSDGGVHSHLTHIFALLELCKKNNFSDVFVHCYLDGRDVPPSSGAGFVKQLQDKIDQLKVGRIASVCGRYYAMDRDNRWERVKIAYDMLTSGEGNRATDAVEAIKQSYASDVLDEFVMPTIVVDNEDKPVATIGNNDSVVFFNFRPDRARELTRAFTVKDFNNFPTCVSNIFWVCFTQYDISFDNVEVAFKPTSISNTLGDYLSALGKTQLRIAETEKYAHVTFFFNGGVEAIGEGEDRALISSPKVATYDLKPSMSAEEVTEEAIKRIELGKYDVMVLNYANCDMVGHTGLFNAAAEAVRTVDNNLKHLVEAILAKGGRLFVTADHGNAEQMEDDNGNAFTAHTTNVVPFIFVDNSLVGKVQLSDGKLCDIAPTMLSVMSLDVPSEMTGVNLIKKV